MPASADRLVLRDGKTIEGEVITEDDKTVLVEVWVPPLSFYQKRISKPQIKTWVRPSREGAAYVTIPIFGTIGDDVTVDALRAGLQDARAAKPRYVILAIDSGGGSIAEMAGMLELLQEASKEFEIVAYVKSAHSAAAVIAMSCRHVFMRPGATIGATVPFRMTEDGPRDVDAKWRSIIEAEMRAAARRGGHADLLIRGMSEIDLELFLAEEDGKPSLRTSGPGKRIKSKGQILTLTSDEAAECGLARVAPSMTELGTQVCGGAWHEVSRRAWNTTVGTVAAQRQRTRDELWQQHQERRRQQLLRTQREAYARIKPELDTIEHRVAELVGKGVAAERAGAGLIASHNREIDQIEAERSRAIAQARQQRDPSAATARAIEVANGRAAAARQSLDLNLARLRADAEAAHVELLLLRDRQNQLLAAIPTD